MQCGPCRPETLRTAAGPACLPPPLPATLIKTSFDAKSGEIARASRPCRPCCRTDGTWHGVCSKNPIRPIPAPHRWPSSASARSSGVVEDPIRTVLLQSLCLASIRCLLCFGAQAPATPRLGAGRATPPPALHRRLQASEGLLLLLLARRPTRRTVAARSGGYSPATGNKPTRSGKESRTTPARSEWFA